MRTGENNTKSYTEFTGVGGRLGDEQPHHSHVNKPAMEYFYDYVPPSRQDIRPKPYIPSEVERARVTKNLFPEIRGKERDRNIVSTDYVTAYEAKTKDSCASTTGSTHVVWSDRGVCPTINEAARFRPIPSTRVVSSSTTYPKLLAGVEIFDSVRSPMNLDHDMSYAERTGAGYSTTSPGGTIKYQYFEPLESRVHKERNVTQLKEGGLGEGHSVVPIQEHTDLLGGRDNRYITRPGPQFFRGSGGDMLGKFGGRFTRPTPTEQYRGEPLDNMRPPRPPQSGAQTRDVYTDFRDVTAVPACRHDDQGDAGCGHYVPLQEKGPPDLNQSFYGEIRGRHEKIGFAG